VNVNVDLPLDLNTQDETGLPWTFLDEPLTCRASSRAPGSSSEAGRKA